MQTLARITMAGVACLLTVATSGGCALVPSPTGWGLGGGVSMANPQFDLDDAERKTGTDIDAQEVTGFDVRLSRHLTDDFDLELAYQALNGLDLDLAAGPSADLDIEIWTVNLRGSADINERSRVYAYLGAGLMRADLGDPTGLLDDFDDAAPVGRGGVGVEYDLADHIGLFLDGTIVSPWSDLQDLDLLIFTTGLQLRF